MALRPRAEATAAVLALLLCGAFVASFIGGLGRPAAAPSAVGPAAPTLTVPDRVVGRVEVLNGSGRAGLARSATERLRTGGFDVVYFGNAPAAVDSSRVLDRMGSTAVARAAARRLGIPNVVTQRDSSLFVDATIVLGSDWQLTPDSTPGRRTEGWRSRFTRWFR
jgi:LytR cell envelope-related transcriptional attenuator